MSLRGFRVCRDCREWMGAGTVPVGTTVDDINPAVPIIRNI